MFENLAHFGLRRSPVQAVGFYLAWLLATLGTGLAVGEAATLAVGDGAVDDPQMLVLVRAVRLTALLFSLALSYAVLRRKRALWHPLYMAIFIAGALAAMVLGPVVGTLAPAILTTCASRRRPAPQPPSPAPPAERGPR